MKLYGLPSEANKKLMEEIEETEMKPRKVVSEHLKMRSCVQLHQ